MNPRLQQTFRWLVIVACCGLSACLFIPTVSGLGREPADAWPMRLFMMVWMGALASLPLGVAFWTYRRSYRTLWNGFSSICALATFFLAQSLPHKMGLLHFINSWSADLWLSGLRLALSILCLVGPFLVAREVFRLMSRFEDRYFDHGNCTHRHRPVLFRREIRRAAAAGVVSGGLGRAGF
jgi:hypothetical protein